MGVATRGRALLFVAIAIGLAVRLWEGFESSLWLDELHSLAHASPPDVAGVLEHTHWDFHAPLFFVALHFVRDAMSPEALRIIPILSNLLVLAPLLVFARRSRLGASAPALAAMLFATLPFQIQYATELRPYAWLTLASAVACCAAFTDAGSRVSRFVLFAVAVAFGLLTHYLMAIAVLLIGATRLLFLLPPLRKGRFTSAPPLLGFWWLVLAGAVGACAFLPWLLDEMSWVVDRPEELVPVEAPEQTVTAANRTDLLQAPLKTLVPQIRALGSPWSGLAMAGTIVLAIGIVGSGAIWLVRAFRRDLPAANRATALAVTFSVLSLLVLGMSIWGWARVSIRYLCVSAWLWPVILCEMLAAVRAPRLRAALAALLLIGALLAGIAHAGGTTHEDVRGAVALARSLGAELATGPARPLYTALLSQPPRFEHCTPYLAYAKDLECVELKRQIHAGPQAPLLPMQGEPGFERPVVVVTRRWLDLDDEGAVAKAVRDGVPEVARLRTGRRLLKKVRVDETMSVWVFAPEAR